MTDEERPQVISFGEGDLSNISAPKDELYYQKKWNLLYDVYKFLRKTNHRPESESNKRRKWLNRRLRLADKGYGGIKDVADAVDNSRFFPVKKKPTVVDYTKEYLLPSTFSPKPKSNDVIDASVVMDTILARDESPREYGVGAAGDILQNEYSDEPIPQFVRQQMDEMEDYRPYFTYWITTVQILIMVISLIWYSIAPIDVELSLKSDFVFTESLTYQQVAFYQPSNFWIGPKPSDVIHLGAVFAPCMRRDDSIQETIGLANSVENEMSGCCVRNDGSGCLQTTRNKCSPLLSTFYKWNHLTSGPEGRINGPVCGQDPRFCQNPISQSPNAWSDDLKKWPVCLDKNPGLQKRGAPPFMTCKITAKPCCIGIHGRCEMRSKEYCQFVGGFFHSEANLCSQVNCMQDVCGMFSFATKGSPDQFYRLWTSLFLHAGLVHLVLTLMVHWFIMRDLERLVGPVRMAALYFGAGIMTSEYSLDFRDNSIRHYP